jgi:hypothetical protein
VSVLVEEFFCGGGFSQTDTEEDVVLLVKGCNTGGGWFLEPAIGNGLFDKNEDGYICTKDVKGKGNSANTHRKPGQDGSHVDGHNHKDNN